MLSAIIAIVGGLIAASSLIIAKKPNAQELLDKLTPYQGWIGVVLTFWGVWGIIQSFLNIGSIGMYWSIGLAISAVEFIVGFLLAYSLISKYVLEKNETAKAKGQELRQKLTKYQVPAGVILIVLGVLNIIL
ncbi:hypothetical protein [uncultured Polaribacter sp.]|uniref:hypothetical protein n=1 Tax=uncultured Polaribacter sp. TaxID=174711 RepID=UPI00262F8DC5|nr:hypothetical protein [uncultured Polaribacter sp.]